MIEEEKSMICFFSPSVFEQRVKKQMEEFHKKNQRNKLGEGFCSLVIFTRRSLQLLQTSPQY